MNTLVYLLLLIPSFFFGQNTEISLEDIWSEYRFYPKSLDELHWVGENDFALLKDKKTFKPSIISYSLETGEQTDVLLESKEYENFIKNVMKSKVTPFSESNKELNDFLVSDFKLGPNENLLLLELGSKRLYRYSTKSYLLLYDRAQAVFAFLPTKTRVFYPQFSPDGQFVSYVSDNNIFIYNIKSKKVKKLTTNGEKNKVINGMSDWVYEEEFVLTQAYEWSANSKEIAYLSFDESSVKTYDVQLWKDDLYPKNYTYKYPKAGEENSKIKLFTVHVDNAENVLVKDYSEQDVYIPRLYWVNNKVTVLKLNRQQNELYLLQFGDDKKRKEQILYKEKAENYIEWKDHLCFMDDGFVVSNETSGFRHLYFYNYKGDLIRQLTNGIWAIDEVFGETNGSFYFSSTQGSIFERAIYKVNLEGNKKVIVNAKGINKLQISPEGAFLVNHNSSFQVPDNYNVIDSEGAFIRSLETNEKLYHTIKSYELPIPVYFTYQNSNGDTLNAYFLKPVDFDSTKKYPVLLSVYGGPGHQVLKNEYSGFNYFWYTHLTQQGYIVALVDTRGTGGRGRAFREQTYGKLGELESDDIGEVAEHIRLMSFVDENRLGIWGWSYGGYLSSLLAMQGGVFNVSIAVAPVTSWRFYDSVYAERYLGLPKDNAHGYDWNSPTNFAEGLDCNYLLIHGTGDDNVHIQNAVFMQNALIDANKQFDVFYYPDRNHGIYGGNTRLHLYHLMTNYLLKNL
jgi:dipeptidyl-peptidase-4